MYRKRLIPLMGLLLTFSASPVANAQDVQVSNLAVVTKAGQSMRLTWTRGNLDGVIVVMRLSSDGIVAPADGSDYTPNPEFGDAGSEIPPNNYVVYKGTGTSVLVTGLAMSTSYSVAAYEFSGAGAGTTYLAGPAQVTDSTTDYNVHNYDFRADCDECHNHGSFGARGAELKAICSTCHNPTGLASAKLEFGYEEVPTTTGHPDPTRNPGIDVVDCGMCHELHNHSPTSTNTTYSTHSVTLVEQHNKSFLRANVDKYVPGATTPAYLHTDTPGGATPDRAVEGGTEAVDPPTPLQARGYCQVCHTATLYHRSTNTAGSEQCHDGAANDSCAGTEVNCGDCHQHTGNFEGAGDCTACHNSARGIRPEIVSQFNRATSHVTPNAGTVTEEDCLVCHDQSTHQAQTVRINDPDDGAASFSQPTAGAPTLQAGQGSAFEQACLNCHDSNGATRLTGNTGDQTPLSPFTDAPAPPVFDAVTFGQSSHGASSIVTCLGDGTGGGCHGSGHGSENAALLAPAGTQVVDDHITNLCAGCHDADGPSAFDIAGEFDWATPSPPGTPASPDPNDIIANTGARVNWRHDVTVADQAYSGAGAFDCNDCHRPHEDASQQIVDPGGGFVVQSNPVVNPDTGAALQVYSIDNTYTGDATSFTYYDGTDSWPDLDPTNPDGGTLIREPDYIEFCLVCHDGTTPPGVTMSANMLNMADSYRLNDQHGRLEGRSSTSRGYLKQPWASQADYDAGSQPGGGNSTYAALNCTLCHGPHGSGNIFNLRTSITVNGVQMTVGGKDAFRDPALCTRQCDSIDNALPEFGSTTYVLPVQEDLAWGAWCTFCHEPSHGTSDGTGCQSGHLHGGGNF